MAFGSRRHPCRLASVLGCPEWCACVGVCAGVFEEDCSLKKKKKKMKCAPSARGGSRRSRGRRRAAEVISATSHRA